GQRCTAPERRGQPLDGTSAARGITSAVRGRCDPWGGARVPRGEVVAAEGGLGHLWPRGLDFVRRRGVRVRCPRDCRDLDDLRVGAPPGRYGDAACGGDSRNGRGPIAAIAGGDPARLRTDWAILAA